jgi:MFS family permease
LPTSGKYEHRVSASLFLFFVGAAFLNYNFSFFLLNPDTSTTSAEHLSPKTYTCYPINSNEGYPCSLADDICGNKETKLGRWERNEKLTLSNWIDRLGLECAEPYQIGLFGTLSYFGEVLANFVLPPLSDKYGRRYFTLFGCIVQLLVYLIYSFSRSYTLNLSLMLLFGLSVTIRYTITYSHLMELYPKLKAAKISSLLFFIDGFNSMYSPAILLWVGDTQVLLYLGALCQVGALGLYLWSGPRESVKLLLAQGKYD